ncbi:hypothetical protein RKE29_15640 [Streptomyces sp. B1866]|uniref:hypothetical protein n=1 Tax=Streptomyces sp. B1866 TaxID=3075431 RepID=UPI00288DE8A7|nr:hypothetical protein [Streptomyces sp. B1866]MDT3398057.1 hypothetical protein [Streptomyces sp. B1866]
MTTVAPRPAVTAPARPAAQDTPAPAAAVPAPAPARPAVPMPSVHMRVLITWLAVFPSITAAQLYLGPHLLGLSVPMRVLVITGLVVPCVVYAFVPVLLKARAAVWRRLHR